jgi:Ca2+-binding RTX toxin-like protein
MRLTAGAAAALALALALPASASAAGASAQPSCEAPRGEPPDCYTFSAFVAGAGEANDLVVSFAGGFFSFRDAVPVAIAGVCHREDERTAVCPADAATVDVGDGADRVLLPDVTSTSRLVRPIATLLGEGDDAATGGAAADQIDAGPGDDGVEGRDGADTITLGPGADVSTAGAGNDVIDAGDVTGNLSDDVVARPPAPDRVDGGAGFDQLSFGGDPRAIEVDLATGAGGGAAAGDRFTEIEAVAVGDGPSSLAGDAHANWLTAGDGGNRLAGRGGNDSLLSGMGNDVLDGGDGDDELVTEGRRDHDVVLGGPGDDAMSLAGGGFVDAGAGDDRITIPPEAHDGRLRVRCGDGEDVAQSGRGVSIAADCEWLDLGTHAGQMTVRNGLRLRGRTLTIRYRGYFAIGRLVLRDRRTSRRLGSVELGEGGRGDRTARMRLSRAAARRVRRVPVSLRFGGRASAPIAIGQPAT